MIVSSRSSFSNNLEGASVQLTDALSTDYEPDGSGRDLTSDTLSNHLDNKTLSGTLPNIMDLDARYDEAVEADAAWEEEEKQWTWLKDPGNLTRVFPEDVYISGRYMPKRFRRTKNFLHEYAEFMISIDRSRLKEYFEWPDNLAGRVHTVCMAPIMLICHSVIHWAEEGKYLKLFYVMHPPCALVAVFFFFERM